MLPKDENDFHVSVEVNQGFKDMQTFFQGHFDAQEIKLKSLKKNIDRFHDLNKKWGRDECESKDEYYNMFSPVNWNNLSDSEKCKHTLFCNECPKIYCELVAKFPSNSNVYRNARMENPIHVAEAVKRKLKKNERLSWKVTMNKVCKEINTAFVGTYGVSFDDSFQVQNKLEKQSNESKRQLKCKHYKEVVDKINSENEATMVDRLYGSSISLSKWDKERKKKYFETVPEAEKRSSAEKVKVKTGLKKAKDHVGSFSSYQIDTAVLETAASWTAKDHISWKKIGDQYIRGQNGKIPSNSGQIAKLYLEDKENHGFQYVYKGKDEQLHDRVRRKKKTSHA